MAIRERLRRLFYRPPHQPIREGRPYVLLTGSAGRIGLSLREQIGDHYNFRCFDRQASPGCPDAIRASITDSAALRTAMSGVGAVVHLASPHGGAVWDQILTDEIDGTYQVFEAARQAGVERFVLASTNHVSGWLEREGIRPIDARMPVRPDSLYAVGKVFSEALGRYYADRWGMTVLCLRIGSFRIDPGSAELKGRVAQTWCSPGDLAQLVRLCLDRELRGFHVYFGVSDNTGRFWDIEDARQTLGYQPHDDAASLLR